MCVLVALLGFTIYMNYFDNVTILTHFYKQNLVFLDEYVCGCCLVIDWLVSHDTDWLLCLQHIVVAVARGMGTPWPLSQNSEHWTVQCCLIQDICICRNQHKISSCWTHTNDWPQHKFPSDSDLKCISNWQCPSRSIVQWNTKQFFLTGTPSYS